MSIADVKNNKQVVRKLNKEIFNKQNYGKIDEIIGKGFIQHGPISGQVVKGSKAYVESIRMYHEAFSGLQSKELECIAEGDMVCTRYEYSGQHTGEFMGIEPTDEQVSIEGIVMSRIKNGKIAESFVSVDFAGLMDQVGAIDIPEQH